jgi:hypothetical protein
VQRPPYRQCLVFCQPVGECWRYDGQRRPKLLGTQTKPSGDLRICQLVHIPQADSLRCHNMPATNMPAVSTSKVAKG